MNEYRIPIYGIIGKKQDENDTNIYFGVEELSTHLAKAKDYNILTLDISSIGGNCNEELEMEQMLLNSGKELKSINSGHVASAASRLFCLATDRTFDPSKGKFLPHNPWGEISGDSEVMQEAAKILKSFEVDYEMFYAKQTGIDAYIISDIMAKNTPLSTEDIEKYNFAKIKIAEFQAVATFNFNFNNNQMTETQNAEMKTWFQKIESMFKKFAPKAIMITAANGDELEFPDINDATELATGTTVLLGGAPFTGESLQSDGSIIVAENGVVTEIKQPTQQPDETQLEIIALKEKISNLESQAKVLESEKVELSKNLAFAKSEFEAFQNKYSSFVEAKSTPEEIKKETKKGFTYKRK